MFYFRHIGLKYGRAVKDRCSKWVKGVTRILVLREQLTFLMRCKKSNVFPKHIDCRFHNEYFGRHCSKSVSHDLEKSTFFFKNKLLSYEIRNLNFEIKILDGHLKELEGFLYRNLENNDLREFFHNQERYFNKIKYEKRKKLKRKFELILEIKHSRINYKNDSKNWFRNLTDEEIPAEVINVMSKGSKFGLPYLSGSLPIKNIIAEAESRMFNFSDVFKNDCRKSLVKVISNFKQENKFDKYVHANLFHDLKITNVFLKENPNIIFQKADKGNVTVASYKNNYIKDIKCLLDDETTYKKIRNPHINKLQGKLRDLLSHWEKKKFIDKIIFKKLKCENGTIAKCYGLPKIHKKQLTYRIIISSINFPTYNLARWLSDILINVVGKTSSFVKDSWNFYDMVKDIVIPNNYKMVSLDVVSLFTNVPLELVNEIINDKWSDISMFTDIPQDEILKAIKLVFNNTVFSFDGSFYEQSYGCPMGSPLSPVIANLVMEKLEGIALSKLNFEPIIYKRYVDDIFSIVPECFVDEMVEVFNSIHERIKFTKEVEENDQLSFLDINVVKVKNGIKLNWYRKPTWSGRFLNYNSHHQFGNKIGTLRGVIDRAVKLAHPDFRKDNLKLVKEVFVNNDYPIDLINKVIKERVHEIYNGKSKGKFELDIKKGMYFVLPYVRGLSERLKAEFKKHNIQIFFRNINNLSKLFNNCKDRDKKDDKSGVVYKINCNECDKYYIGQTGRFLKKRIYEHTYSLKNPNLTSGLKQHCLEYLHSFDFKEVEILEDGIKNKVKRETFENIHIFQNKNNVNVMLESSKLSPIYHPLLA